MKHTLITQDLHWMSTYNYTTSMWKLENTRALSLGPIADKMRGGAVKVVQVRGGNFTKHITSERAAHYCDQGQPLQPGPSSGAVSIKRRFVSSHRISSSTHGRSYRPGETRAALMASTSTWDQGFALHTSAYITDIIKRHFFTLQFHFVPTRLTKKVKHKLRAKLRWTSLASEPREQGHNYPKPVISDLGHGGCEYRAQHMQQCGRRNYV